MKADKRAYIDKRGKGETGNMTERKKHKQIK